MTNPDAARTLAVRDLASRIRRARRLTILTGAGVSAASGIPTFRGPQGLWRKFRPEDLATPEAFARDPQVVWEWYAWRREQIAACQPNAAHDVIANWANGVRPRNDPSMGSDPVRRTFVITQNVDDLHLRAGTPSLIRLHGSIWELSCAARCQAGAEPWLDERAPISSYLPRRPHRGDLARPAVVWFGESLDHATLDAALQATACDVFLTVGTSSLVYPSAGLVHEAQRRGAFTAEINLEATPASSAVDLAIHGPAEQILPLLSE